MTDFDSLRADIAACSKAIDGYTSTAVHHLLEQSRQIDRLWEDNAELRDELHALANRHEALTRTVTAKYAERIMDRRQT